MKISHKYKCPECENRIAQCPSFRKTMLKWYNDRELFEEIASRLNKKGMNLKGKFTGIVLDDTDYYRINDKVELEFEKMKEDIEK